ncbi:MAG: hypothetical protein CMJ31_08515 [Phycisphaerae bacterium]|nr:hypothetical protein [Phycisphaerae bacterium]
MAGVPWWVWMPVVTGVVSLASIVLLIFAIKRRAATDPNLDPAPGWYLRCGRCGTLRSLASAGGVRIGANRNAEKATLGRCSTCRKMRIIQIIHEDRLSPQERAGLADAGDDPEA